MAITNEVDLTHIARTTEQWENTYDRNVIIPEGVLCIEFTPSGKTNIKIGDGHHIFSRLPYVNGSSEIIDCYTKQETDNRIIQILNNECVVRIKGILDDASKLPVHAACGDLWFVIRQNPEQGNKFEEYLYSSEHHWELVGGTPVDIDLSKYATKEYVDDKIRDIENKLHTHDNKSILDQITAAFTKEEKEKLKNLYNYDDTELRELIAKSLHTHSNKEVLDAITKYDIDKLRTLENYDDTLLKKKITALEALAHEHSNKSILDKTTASFTTDYERLMSLIRLYIGATGFDDGAAGLVPPAKAGEQNYVLTGSGKWVPNAGGETYELPIASATELGGIKIGEGLEISEDGTLTVVGGAGSGTGGNYNEGDGIKFKQETGKPLYRVLEYIEATGTQRIDTDILLTGTSHVVDITYQFTDISVDNYLYTVGGIFDTGGQVYGILKTTVQELCSGVGQGGQAYNYVAVSPPTEKTSDTYFVNSTSFGSTLTGSKDHQIPILNDTISFFGFIRNTYTNYLGKVKLYGCTVKCDDVIKANFIPVMRISDNVSGLYDTVSKKFFTDTYNETPFVTGNPTEEVISDYITTINVKPATETEIGGVIIGDGINVDENGVISVDASATIDLKTGDGLEIVDVVNPEHTKLPNGYGEISYLESSNGQYTIIDYVPNENTRVVCEFSYQESNVGDQCLFGTRTGNTSGSRQFVLWMEWDSSKPYTGFVYGGNNWGGADVPSDGYALTCEIGQKMVADVSVNGYYLDNTLIHTVTNTGSPSAYKLAIFHLSNSNTTVESNKTAFKGRIYSFKIYENDVLVANLVPAIVMALNIPGFYDVINNKFYQSSTSNSFTYDASSVIIDSAEKQINLLPATTTDIGGIIVGDGLSITEDGVLSTTSESGMQYEAGRAIEITDKIIPGDLTLDIFQDGTNWANGAYTSSTGNGFLPGYGASVHSPVGNVDSMFKVPDNTNRYRVEKRSVDGTQLSCTVSYIDAAGYRFAASPVWEDDDTTIHECPDGTVYISIGIRWLDHSSPISVSDIGVVNLVWIGAGKPVDNVKIINAQIATTETPGVVTVGNGLTVTEEGVISVDAIPLEPATADKLGGVKIGEGLTITEEGVLSATASMVYNAGKGISITKGSHKIPVEYQEVEYIESAGSAIFDTGYLVNPSTVIDMDCIVYESSKADWQFLYGSRSSTYDTATVFGFVVRNYHKGYVPELWISGEQLGTSSTFPYNERTILKQNMNELTWYPVSTEVPVTITGTGNLPTSTTTLAVSGFKDGSTYTFGPKCRIYSLKISDVNGITRDYVPCYRISDGVVGLYDLINDTFRYSATSTAFISGPVVSDSGGSTDDELYINNTGLLDANLKEDAPGIIIVSKADETKELDVFQYMTDIEVYCIEDSI